MRKRKLLQDFEGWKAARTGKKTGIFSLPSHPCGVVFLVGGVCLDVNTAVSRRQHSSTYMHRGRTAPLSYVLEELTLWEAKYCCVQQYYILNSGAHLSGVAIAQPATTKSGRHDVGG